MDQLVMSPAPGARLLRFVGDTLRVGLRPGRGGSLPEGCRAFLRTNLGRAVTQREEIVKAHAGGLPLAGASWRDIPLKAAKEEWLAEFPVVETGYFKAKAYVVDADGRQYWPNGPDIGVTVHPNDCRTANTLYCAFTRMFGASKNQTATFDSKRELEYHQFDEAGFTLIPPSGTLRDLAAQAPHIFETLGCRILHLLPINPTPTTCARFGRYGSPYASLDFTAIDPALVQFDRHATAVDQFRELARAVHGHRGRLFLDLAINHTGWGSTFLNTYPEWFLRDGGGAFQSPGAWGTVWEDLVELAHRTPDLWAQLAGVFLVWCRRGVDGFRCDAGYKVPTAAWQFIIARVRQEFPETVFLLEGLGGSWEATETLLTEGGMQWAYSELFQNYQGKDVAAYLDYSLRQGQRVGCYVHYSETHDNHRLAAQGRAWSLLRNRLCALTSVSGGYGFTCGVEWLAAEKVDVHRCSGLSWNNPDNIVNELAALNRLLAGHPCFFDGARLTRLSGEAAPVYVLRREAAEDGRQVLVLVNTNIKESAEAIVKIDACPILERPLHDLLGQAPPAMKAGTERMIRFTLGPGACHCLSDAPMPDPSEGEAYRLTRARTARALQAISRVLPSEKIGPFRWRSLADILVKAGPVKFLAALPVLDPAEASENFETALQNALARETYPRVVVWEWADQRRVTLVPPDHWLLVCDAAPFQTTVRSANRDVIRHIFSFLIGDIQVTGVPPNVFSGDAQLVVERYAAEDAVARATVRFLAAAPVWPFEEAEGHPVERFLARESLASRTALLTNGRGGMARLCLDLGRVNSKYDCLLAANLHPTIPVDRHVFAKRIRVWILADGFQSPLDAQNLAGFDPGPPAVWRFQASAGDGRRVEIHLTADMLDHSNTTVLRFTRPPHGLDIERELPDHCPVRLIVRVDIEDRSYHAETHRNSSADLHFMNHSRPLEGQTGFEFTPTAERGLRVWTDGGRYYHEAEWCPLIPHPVEQSRGQTGSGDAYSPGWFELPMTKGAEITMVISAEKEPPTKPQIAEFEEHRARENRQAVDRADVTDAFGRQLARALQAFIVDRDGGKTVIAGYPWFLDWGRDSLICARGALAAGRDREVAALQAVFGRFAEAGTLPNYINGNDASNRDTSDAPLWYGVVCEEAAAKTGMEFYSTEVAKQGRTIADVLLEIADGYACGASNGVRMDPASGLIWSPSHFTWMDTNYPAATPREGYPVEIQALWIRLLRQLERLQAGNYWSGRKKQPALPGGHTFGSLADKAGESFQKLFWLENPGWFADVLLAAPAIPAAQAVPDNALRSNALLAVSLGIATGERARRSVEAARRYLVIPGALRSLAPLPVSPPLPVRAPDGHLLNDPNNPYWGHYEGDEDTRRKPAYHNGTAWTWTFPIFCEALAAAWNYSPEAVAAARAYLGSMDQTMLQGCVGQIPEIVDGDAPHTQRGCDAQAWGVTEALRVWKKLSQNA
jgi:predicted glycogen debranching enzyme